MLHEDDGHGLGHTHGHGGATERALKISLLLNAIFLVVEAGIGLATGSLALLSDAAHMLGDVAALALALFAARLAVRAATPERTFGFVRAEVLGAFVNAVGLALICALIFSEAVERLTHGVPDVAGWPVLVAGAAGLLINLGSAWVLWRSDSESLNVRAALAHMLADALGSVGAMLAAVGILLGWPMADPIISIAIGALVLFGAWRLLCATASVLLQVAPSDVDVEALDGALRGVGGVCGLHDLHVWSLDGRKAIVTAHLVARPGSDVDGILGGAERALEEGFGILHTTFQVEQANTVPCHQECCVLLGDGERHAAGSER